MSAGHSRPTRSRRFCIAGLALLGCSAPSNDATNSVASAGSVSSGGASMRSQQAESVSGGATGATSLRVTTTGSRTAEPVANSSIEASGGSTSSGFHSTKVDSIGGSASNGKASGGNESTSKSSGGNPNSSTHSTTSSKSTGGSSAKLTTSTKVAAGGTTSDSGSCLGSQEMVVPDGYTLVWSDEFDVDGDPDPSNWGYETGFVRNEEAQWYQPDNAWVEQGCLIIEGRRERKANPNYKAGSSDWKTNRQYAEYTSSSLRSMGKRTWQYGRFEMRGRIKTQAGLWPAWWTLGEAKEWPSCGEIDIMEYYAGYVRANVACGTSTRWQAKWDSASWKVADFENKNWQNEFHVWRMDWDAQNIVLYLDDKQFNTTKLSDMLNPDGSSPFKQPHYVLLNLAIGGNNGGDASKTTFPTRFEVDYVRVFQKQ